MGLVRFDVVRLDAEHVVDELGLAALRVEAPAAESAALRDDHALGALGGHLEIGGDGERLVLDADDAVLGQASHARKQQLPVALDQRRPAGQLGNEALDLPVVERQHVELDRFDQPQPLQLVQLLGHLLRQVVGLRPVLAAVVQLPHVVVEGRHLRAAHLPRRAVLGHRAPALVVDARGCRTSRSTASRAAPARFGVVEAVEHARAFVRALLHAVDHRRLGKAGRFQDRRGEVDDVAELIAHAAFFLDARSASARWCRCACRPSATRPAWSTDRASSSPRPSPRRSGRTIPRRRTRRASTS